MSLVDRPTRTNRSRRHDALKRGLGPSANSSSQSIIEQLSQILQKVRADSEVSSHHNDNSDTMDAESNSEPSSAHPMSEGRTSRSGGLPASAFQVSTGGAVAPIFDASSGTEEEPSIREEVHPDEDVLMDPAAVDRTDSVEVEKQLDLFNSEIPEQDERAGNNSDNGSAGTVRQEWHRRGTLQGQKAKKVRIRTTKGSGDNDDTDDSRHDQDDDDDDDDGSCGDDENEGDDEDMVPEVQLHRTQRHLEKSKPKAALEARDILPLYHAMEEILRRGSVADYSSRQTPQRPVTLDYAPVPKTRRPPRLARQSASLEVKLLQNQLRKVTMFLMGRDTKKSPFPKPPTKKEVDLVEKTKRGGPTKENFNLDVMGYRKRSLWNQRGALILARLYVETKDCITDDVRVVQEQVLRHIPALVRQYELINVDHMEPRQQERLEKNFVRDIRNSRCKSVSDMKVANEKVSLTEDMQLGMRRLDIASSMSALRKFSNLLDTMGTGAISGDETDTGKTGKTLTPPRYRIVKLPWRSPELTNVMRILDLIHLQSRFSSVGRATAGNWPRYRVESSLEVDSRAIRGLPRNCYDPTWLREQDENMLEDLDIQPPVDLSIPERISMYDILLSFSVLNLTSRVSDAKRYAHVKGPNDRPLPAERGRPSDRR
ncbi:hypothetical protein QCA50_018563 [Cerrena zonata]|uniref:Uncharacterized protein n=1 Tax=Cerrena zonata TaxID=2478898 RepID=A0AAW0FEE0_9APHY